MRLVFRIAGVLVALALFVSTARADDNTTTTEAPSTTTAAPTTTATPGTTTTPTPAVTTAVPGTPAPSTTDAPPAGLAGPTEYTENQKFGISCATFACLAFVWAAFCFIYGKVADRLSPEAKGPKYAVVPQANKI